MSAPIDKSKSYFPLAGGTSDGYTTDTATTCTCYCGAVQLLVPTTKPGLIDTFICHCSDCHKFTASMHATNWIALSTHLTHLRGESNLSTFSMTRSIISKGNTMTNFFCKTCGTLMYRRGTGFPGMTVGRVGTVDDYGLMETVFRPRVEQFKGMMRGWEGGVKGGVVECEGYFYGEDHEELEEEAREKRAKEGKGEESKI